MMRKKILSGLVAAALVVSLSVPTMAAPGFVGSVFNSGNGVAVSENKKPTFTTATGEQKTLTVAASGTEQKKAETQEERKEILKNAEATVLVSQPKDVTEMLDNFFNKEIKGTTTLKEVMESMVENGVSVVDAVKTAAITNTIKESNSVSEVLDALSDVAKSQVQEAAKKDAEKKQEAAKEKTEVLRKALELVKELPATEDGKVDTKALVDAFKAEDETKAAALEKVIEKLEKQNIEITPEVLEKVIEKQEKRQEVLEEIKEGNVDHMSVHSVLDVSVSDDIKENVSEDGSYVEISLDMPGVDEDTLAVALKPMQEEEINVEDENLLQEMQSGMNAAGAKNLFQKMGNRFDVINCTTYEGGITLEMPNFSPVMILTYADTTTDIFDEEAEENVAEPEEVVEEAVAEVEEPAAESGSSMVIPVVVVAAIVVVVIVFVFNKKKSDGTDKK